MSKRQTPEEKRAYNRERYRRSRDKILAQQKERYEKEKERILEERGRYYENNKEKVLARSKLYYQENSERIKERERTSRSARKIAAAVLLGGRCEQCGWDEHPAALDFHHKDPEDKLFSISDMISSRKMVPDDVFETEVLKCELICKNCHAIEHCKWEIDRNWNGMRHLV